MKISRSGLVLFRYEFSDGFIDRTDNIIPITDVIVNYFRKPGFDLFEIP